jgi:hypothetical protein
MDRRVACVDKLKRRDQLGGVCVDLNISNVRRIIRNDQSLSSLRRSSHFLYFTSHFVSFFIRTNNVQFICLNNNMLNEIPSTVANKQRE